MTEPKVHGPKGGKLTILLEPELHREIKLAAVREGYTMRDYILDAVQEKMAVSDSDKRKAS